MLFHTILIFLLVNSWTILIVNSLPQNEISCIDSISLNTDRNVDPNDRPIQQRDSIDSSGDSTSQDSTTYSDDSMNQNLDLGLKTGPQFFINFTYYKFCKASNNVDPSIVPANEVALENSRSETNSPTPTIDEILAYKDDVDPGPLGIGRCPDGKKWACCHYFWGFVDLFGQTQVSCWWRQSGDTCNDYDQSGFLCCRPNPYNMQRPDPSSCEDGPPEGKGGPFPSWPPDIPGRKKPKLKLRPQNKPTNQEVPLCRPRGQPPKS